MILEGRVVGPWVDELDRVWNETAPRLGSKKLAVDLSDMTYADAAGRSVLRIIFSHAGAKLVAASLGVEDLAGSVNEGCLPN
jgi:ABC-type transporter Mla MlaB component